jgi:hypothetical protein
VVVVDVMYGWCFVSKVRNVPEIIARQMLILRVGGKGVLRGCVSWIIRGYVVVCLAGVLLQMIGLGNYQM